MQKMEPDTQRTSHLRYLQILKFQYPLPPYNFVFQKSEIL